MLAGFRGSWRFCGGCAVYSYGWSLLGRLLRLRSGLQLRAVVDHCCLLDCRQRMMRFTVVELLDPRSGSSWWIVSGDCALLPWGCSFWLAGRLLRPVWLPDLPARRPSRLWRLCPAVLELLRLAADWWAAEERLNVERFRKEDLGKLKLAELQRELEAKGLEPTGKKSEMVDRLWAAMQDPTESPRVENKVDVREPPGSFLTESLARRLKVRRDDTSISIETVGNERRVMQTSLASGLEVCGLDGAEFLPLPPLLTIDRIPVTQSDRCRVSELRAAAHLQGVELHEVDAPVELLLGSNCATLIVPREMVSGEKERPEAARTR
ncbi:hypothetical protein FJT64_009404 [Amphibalanus amphitrite]|uniref:SAP domain-containing protein n=1 Tax=Amphibalanus amphitrite TaxID=1232801 RepID=A0A6A4VHH9_AMPAM|nr:hypothetical protein FJT64_009404 [Amphibalanus amphitrite]